MSSEVFSTGRNETWMARCAELTLPLSIVAVPAAGFFVLTMMLHAAGLAPVELLLPIVAPR